MGTQEFSKSNIHQTGSNGHRTMDEILGTIAERYKKDIGWSGAGFADRLKNMDHAAGESVFSSEGDACDALLELFGKDALTHVVGTACRLGQLDRDAWADLKASNPVAFAEQREAAADILSWAKAIKFLADDLFVKAAVLTDEPMH